MPTGSTTGVVVAIPTYGGIGPEHADAVLALQAWLTAQGAPVMVIHHNLTEIARSRNKLAARFLEQAWTSHLLFIDADIDFKPEAVGALIASDKPLVGAAYPKKQLDLDRLIAAARRFDDPKLVWASALDFVVAPGGDTAEVVDGLCRVAGVGMGLTLIHRSVFQGLMATGRIREDASEWATGGLKGAVYGFFDQITDGPTHLSEDLAFCRRWRELCGGEVWVLVDQEIGHTGPMTFRSRLIDAMEAGAARAGPSERD